MKYLPRELQVVTERPSKNFENKGSHMICDCHAILELSFLLQDFAYSGSIFSLIPEELQT